jgi:hypothetical protein
MYLQPRNQKRRPGHFTPGKNPIPIVQEARWAPCTSGRARKISRRPNFDPRTVHPVASHYTDYATTAAEIGSTHGNGKIHTKH